MNKLVDKQVCINLYPFRRSPFMIEAFSVAARDQGWSETEIALAVNQTRELSLNDKYTILLGYCDSFGEESAICQEDVQFMLAHLNSETHYLWQKPLVAWDEYDWSNYQSLKRQATERIRRVFALFLSSVDEADKYQVFDPKQKNYTTEEEAIRAIPKGQDEDFNIYALWIRE